MGLISPLLWQGTPFEHADAELDFLGLHDKWHSMLARTVGPPLPDYRLDDLASMGDIHQRLHDQLGAALGLNPGGDFSLYELTDRSGWILFMQTHSIEHERLRVAVGL
jgi:hypothetical protein